MTKASSRLAGRDFMSIRLRVRGFAVAILCLLVSATSASAEAAPVPPDARGPEFPLHLKGTLRVAPIRDNLYYVYNGVYQTIFLVSHEGVILVDAPPAMMTAPDGKTLLGEIAKITRAPITDLVYSHSHKDHIGGASMVRAKFPRVRIHAQRATLETLIRARADNPDDTRVLPNRIVDKRGRVAVGWQVLELENRGTFHEPGDLFIYAPRQKVLLAVDVVFPGWVPFVNFSLSKDVRGFMDAHSEILTYDFDTFVGGHLTRLGNRTDVVAAQEYMLAVMDAAGKALSTVKFGEGATPEESENVATLFDIFLAKVLDQCEAEVAPNWLFLGGADTATRGNCFAAQNFIRLER